MVLVEEEGEERGNGETNGSRGNGKGKRNREREEGGRERNRREGEKERDLSCFIINTIVTKKPVEQVLSSTICF